MSQLSLYCRRMCDMMVRRDRLEPAIFANVEVANNSLVIEPGECVLLAERLLALLQYEWESNHSEHCWADWPHPDGSCGWPRPAELSLYAPKD